MHLDFTNSASLQNNDKSENHYYGLARDRVLLLYCRIHVK